jgi:hypothetical protein
MVNSIRQGLNISRNFAAEKFTCRAPAVFQIICDKSARNAQIFRFDRQTIHSRTGFSLLH